MASGFTGNNDDDDGALIGGVVWRAPGALKIQVWDYYYTDVTNQLYFKGDYTYKIKDDFTMTFDLRYLDMVDVGDSLDGDIDTYTVGGNVGLKAYGFKLTGYLGTNGDDTIQAPFGNNRIIAMQVRTLANPEEDAWGIKMGHDFGKVGIKGLSAYTFYSDFDSPDDGANSTADATELDFNIKYKIPDGWFKNCSLRIRYAIVNEEESNGGTDLKDFRTYLEWKF